jgi:hypothetical protein
MESSIAIIAAQLKQLNTLHIGINDQSYSANTSISATKAMAISNQQSAAAVITECM